MIFNEYVKNNNKMRKVYVNQNNLVNGLYKFNDLRTAVYLCDPTIKKHMSNLLENDPIKKMSMRQWLSNLLLKNKLSINNSRSDFSGTIYFFSNNHKADKIFDITNKKIKTVFLEKEEKDNKLRLYDYFSTYFKQPLIFDNDEYTITEEMIQFDHNNFIGDSLINTIFSDYIEYFKNIDQKKLNKTCLNSLLNQVNNVEQRNFFKIQINKDLFMKEYFLIPMHGDLRKNNILYVSEREEIYYIDWELSTEYMPMYDLFFLFYHEAVFSQNFDLISNYLNGIYDEKIETIFDIFGYKYNRAIRKEYFSVFLLEHHVKKATSKNASYMRAIDLGKYMKSRDT